MDALTKIFKQYWGYDSFRPLQQDAMQCVIEGRDSVVVMPTGGGKSLCYQAPAVLMDGMALVVSPLISLMKDQVDALTECGVAAACVNSSLSPEERRTVASDVRGGRLKLLYVAPERVVTERFLEFLKENTVSFIAIDEAHCISMWGHDFRPEYRELRTLKKAFPNIAVHAYTATANPHVREDIARELGLENPQVCVGSFDRPNLCYKVQRRDRLLSQVRAVIDRYPGDSGLVYCIRRKDVESLCAELRSNGYKALPYHAGMKDADRKTNQEAFIREDIDIIVATVAFGMGIDKHNVRYVIHAGMPKTLEHYHQESGRAGRDDLEAECVLLYSGADFGLWKGIIESSEEQGAEIALRKLNDLYDYCTGVTCRHKTVVNYFGQDYDTAHCHACDVCLDELDVVTGARDIASKILRAIVAVDQRFGAAYITKLLVGSREERVLKYRHDMLDDFGGLAEHGDRAVRDWVEQLVAQDYLEKAGEYNVLQLTKAGRALFRDDEGSPAPRLLKTTGRRQAHPRVSKVSKESWEGVDRGLFERLRQLRRDIALESAVPAYVIFGDAALRDMARLRPSCRTNFLQVRGVAERKAEQYGERFVEAIRDYCVAHSLGLDVGLEDADFEAPPVQAPSPTDAKARAFDLFARGCSVEDVSQDVRRATSTVQGYLAEFISQNEITDFSPWLEADTFERIRGAAATVGAERMKPIFDHLNGEVGYDQIRIALACLRNSEFGE